MTRFLRQLIDRADRIARAAGVRVRMPYLDHRLVEYLYNTPWTVKRPSGGASKQLLRDAFGHIVPPSVRQRPKVPYPATATAAYTSLIQHQVTDLLARGSHPVWDLFRREATSQAAATPADQLEGRRRRALERVLDTALWFDTYRPVVRIPGW